MTLDEQTVLSTVNNGRADIVINRPHRKNALTPDTVAALTSAFTDAEENPSVGCVLLSGAGGSFCSGIDLTDSGPGQQIAPFMRDLHQVLATMRTPTVVAVERYAINGGSGLALACDLMVIGTEAFLQISEAQMGVAAPANVAWLVTKVHAATALRLTLSGERFPGAELPSLGVPAKVVPDNEVLDSACEMADRIAGYPAGSGAAMKSSIKSAAAVSASGFAASFAAVVNK